MNQEEINATKAHIKKTHKVKFVGNNPVVSGVYLHVYMGMCVVKVLSIGVVHYCNTCPKFTSKPCLCKTCFLKPHTCAFMVFSVGHSFDRCCLGIFSMINLSMDICLIRVLFIKRVLLGFFCVG